MATRGWKWSKPVKLPAAVRSCLVEHAAPDGLLLCSPVERLTFWVDARSWPPKIRVEESMRVEGASRDRDGRWAVTYKSEASARAPGRVKLYRDPFGGEVGREVALPSGRKKTPPGIAFAGWVGGRLTLFQQPTRGVPLQLYREVDGGAFSSVAEVALDDWTCGFACGVIPLVDGGDVVLWNEQGWELSEGRFKATFPLKVGVLYEPEWVVTGKDGFLTLGSHGRDDDALLEVRRGQRKPARHLPERSGFSSLTDGPDGSALLSHDDGWSLYQPGDHSLSSLGAGAPSQLGWCEDAGRLVGLDDEKRLVSGQR